MLNKIIFMGRITKTPEIRYTQTQKPVASFSVACERDYAASGEKRETDFIDVVAWNNTANFISSYFDKGSMIVVEGRLQSRDWTDRDNNKRRAWEVIADRVYFGEGKKQEPKQEPKPAGEPVSVKFEEMEGEDGELPF